MNADKRNREAVRCPRCGMVQYPTAVNRCRQCYYNGATIPLITASSLVIRETVRPAVDRPGEAVDFAAALRYWRRIRSMTAVEVGTRMGARGQRTQIGRWERNFGRPMPESIMRVARALGIPAPWLLTPWPTDQTSRAILRQASALPAANRQALLERVRAMVIAAN